MISLDSASKNPVTQSPSNQPLVAQLRTSEKNFILALVERAFVLLGFNRPGSAADLNAKLYAFKETAQTDPLSKECIAAQTAFAVSVLNRASTLKVQDSSLFQCVDDLQRDELGSGADSLKKTAAVVTQVAKSLLKQTIKVGLCLAPGSDLDRVKWLASGLPNAGALVRAIKKKAKLELKESGVSIDSAFDKKVDRLASSLMPHRSWMGTVGKVVALGAVGVFAYEGGRALCSNGYLSDYCPEKLPPSVIDLASNGYGQLKEVEWSSKISSSYSITSSWASSAWNSTVAKF